MDNKEKIIKFLIDKYNTEDSNNIRIYKNDIEKLGIDEKEASKILSILNDNKMITIKTRPTHNDFSIFWYVTILPACLEYFDTQKYHRIANRREWVRTYIPVTFSLIAIVISIISLLITIYN